MVDVLKTGIYVGLPVLLLHLVLLKNITPNWYAYRSCGEDHVFLEIDARKTLIAIEVYLRTVIRLK